MYKELEDFLENMILDLHINQFVFKCPNLKIFHVGMFYITETIELVHDHYIFTAILLFVFLSAKTQLYGTFRTIVKLNGESKLS